MNAKPRILIIEDDGVLGPSLVHRLALEGFAPTLATRAAEAVTAIGRARFDAIVSDIRLPDGDGETLYRRALGVIGDTPILFVTAFGDIGQAVRLVKAGAIDYLTKPFDVGALVERLQLLIRERDASACENAGETAVFASPAMQRIEQSLQRLARTGAPVLIRGESGVGKEIVARRLHALSGRAPLVAVNCAAIAAELAESTLFGHEKGSFTGAITRRIGYLEEAGAGTLFLDEIGELPSPLQAKLLRALQERSFRRVGGMSEIAFAARLISATNADLQQLVKTQRFREDLLFRIAVVELTVPPLRERPQDLRLLFHRYVAALASEYGLPQPAIDAEIEPALLAHSWPGNVRELRNRVARALAMAEGGRLTLADLFPERALDDPAPASGATLGSARDDAERQAIATALRAHDGRIAATATALGVSRVTLWSKMKRLGLGG